jgi:hypothetical protein
MLLRRCGADTPVRQVLHLSLGNGGIRIKMSEEVQKPMPRRPSLAVQSAIASFLVLALVPQILTQSDDSAPTMRPVIRGRHAAVASMKAEATEAARRILDAGGNAFDAAVGG